MRRIVIYTDGACRGNPGPGGWAALLRYRQTEKTINGGAAETTNNRMELQAVIEALRILKEKCQVELYTDSTYVKNGITQWLPRWKHNGWRTAGRKPVKNQDLWLQLDGAASKHQVDWHWVKGHSGHPDNDAVDELAREAIPG